jgi:hypothetical protein
VSIFQQVEQFSNLLWWLGPILNPCESGLTFRRQTLENKRRKKNVRRTQLRADRSYLGGSVVKKIRRRDRASISTQVHGTVSPRRKQLVPGRAENRCGCFRKHRSIIVIDSLNSSSEAFRNVIRNVERLIVLLFFFFFPIRVPRAIDERTTPRASPGGDKTGHLTYPRIFFGTHYL